MEGMPEFGEWVQKHYAWMIAGALSILMPLLIWWLNRRGASKAFAYRKVTDTPLVSKRKGAKGKIEILYEGKPVESVRMVEIELRNSGGKAINPQDFHKPVQIEFPVGTELFEPEVIAMHPDNLDAVLESNGSVITLKPLLMNPKDSLTIKVLVPVEDECQLKVTARISDVMQLTEYGEPLALDAGDLLKMTVLVATGDAFGAARLVLPLVQNQIQRTKNNTHKTEKDPTT